MEQKPPTLISLIGLAVGLAETAEEVRAGRPVDPDYLDRVADSLWAYVGNRDRDAGTKKGATVPKESGAWQTSGGGAAGAGVDPTS